MNRADTRQKEVEAFRRQSARCLAFGSPFNAALIAAAADSLARTSPFSDFLDHLAFDPAAAAVPFRLAGALHAAVLSGQDPALAGHYPRAGFPGDGAQAWIAAEDFVARDPAWFDEWLRLPPQTNEVARSAGLFEGRCDPGTRDQVPHQAFEVRR